MNDDMRNQEGDHNEVDLSREPDNRDRPHRPQKPRRAGQRRSIRDVSIDRPEGYKKTRSRHTARSHRGIGGGRTILTIFAILAILFGGFVVVSMFSRANVRVVPKSATVSLDEELSLTENGASEALEYEIISVEETAEAVLASTGTEEVEEYATGKITIYNTFDENDQPLIANTRFQSEDGHIYRISEAIVVPGVQEDGTPGSITVTVTADRAGEEYNVSESRFTVPGLEGDPRYDAFYAEVAEPIDGGFVGVAPVVDPDEEAAAREELRENLESTLPDLFRGALPEDTILVSNSLIIETEELQSEMEGESVAVREMGRAYGVIIPLQSLASFVATEGVEDYNFERVRITNPETLEIELLGEPESAGDLGEIELLVGGQAVLEWVIETEGLAEELAGSPKSSAAEKAVDFRGVKKASVELVPGFVRSLPAQAEKISVTVVDTL